MKTLYFNGAKYQASSVIEILNNLAVDNGYENYNHYKQSKEVK